MVKKKEFIYNSFPNSILTGQISECQLSIMKWKVYSLDKCSYD